jgi:hypothetical protein
MPRLTLNLLLVALVTSVAGATYALWLNPEMHFWKTVAERKLLWVEQMRAKHGHVIGVVGGSTTTFAIDAGMIEREYGLPVANLGLHAGVGAEACAGFGLASLQPGDTLIVSIEPGLLTGEDIDATNLATRLAYSLGKPEMLHWQKGGSFTSRAADLTKLQPGGGHVITMLGKLAMRMPLYRYSAENSLPGGLQVTDERRNFNVAPATTIENVTLSLSPEGAALLSNIRQEGERRGIRVVYVLPWAYVPLESSDFARQANANFLDQVERIIPVLREPEMGVHSDRKDFADSGQHLTENASKKRSTTFALLLAHSLTARSHHIN